MDNRKPFFTRVKDFSRDVRLILLATLITNIGNGMNTIAISKLAYDQTKSAMAFGGVIILQYAVMFMLQFVSGSFVDRNNPKYVSIGCDLIRGFLVLSSGLMVLFTNIGLIYVFFSVILINIVNPFFTSANFTLLPTIIKDKERLLEANALSTTLFQGGQLLGSALVASVIFFFSPAIALEIDGVTFLISATIMTFVSITDYERKTDLHKNVAKNLLNDWKEIFKAMKRERSFAAHLFIMSGDYVTVNLFNLMLVPMVIHWYQNNSFYISLFDGGFAVGAMVIAAFVMVVSKRIGTNNSAFTGLLLEFLLFMTLIISRNPIITCAVTLSIGAANSFSLTIFNTNLQQRCAGPIKGRVSSVKNLIVSCLTVILIPVISRLHDISITYGLLASGGVIFVYAAISFIMGRKFVLGNDYLTKTVELDAKAAG